MKIRNLYICILIAWFFPDIQAQNSEADKLFLFSDRNLYLTGEDIHFQINIFSSSNFVNRIFYTELVSPDGTSYVKSKLSGDNSSYTTGSIKIPRELFSGNYYLKCYTRYQRNFGANSFAYVPVRIVNPNSVKVLEGKNGAANYVTNSFENNSGIVIETDKENYSKRDSIQVQINFKNNSGTYCISVIPEASFFESYPEINKRDEIFGFFQEFQREYRGISLSGSLVHKESQTAIPNHRLTLSVPDEKDFISVNTDSSGRFHFILPYYKGDRDLFLSAGSDISADIKVENDFDTEIADLPALVFQLSEDERNTALQFAANMQLNKHFFPEENPVKTIPLASNPFYGNPDLVVELDNYISLPLIEDYFNELILPASIINRRSGKIFRFNAYISDFRIYHPLVLIDWIAIGEDEKIMKLPSGKIDRIEFVNAPYIKGDMKYGGIISIISKEGDFGGIDLPSTGLFLNYMVLDEDEEEQFIKVEKRNLPDTRNTLEWSTGIVSEGDEIMNLVFRTGDTKGKYIILIRGTNSEGKLIQAYSSLSVN